MDEEKEPKKDEPKEPEADKGEGVQQETISELDRADQIAERQKRENDRREEILNREEALAARKAVGGTAEGGQPPTKPKETPQEYGKRIMTGK